MDHLILDRFPFIFRLLRSQSHFANYFLRTLITNYRTHSTLLIDTLNVPYEAHFLFFHPFSGTTSACPEFLYNLVARIQ